MSVINHIPTVGDYTRNEELLHSVSPQPNEPEYVKDEFRKGVGNMSYQWVASHSEDLQPAITEVAEKVQFISHAKFLKTLDRSLHSITDNIQGFDPKRSIVMVEGMKSNKWVAELALKHFGFEAGHYYRLGSKEACNFQKYLMSLNEEQLQEVRNAFLNQTVFLFDDASYSGKQMSDHINMMSTIFNEYRLKVQTLAVVVPFRTMQANQSVTKAANDAKSNDIKVMVSSAKTLGSLSNISSENYHLLVQAWYKGDRTAADKIGLAWFEHKVPNDQSFPAAVINGSVYDANGTSKKVGSFTIVPHITETYKQGLLQK